MLVGPLAHPRLQVIETLVAVALLPDHDLADLELGLSPGRQPDVAGVPEVLLGVRRVAEPRLARLGVLEPAVGAADGDVDDEVEMRVEGRVGAARLAPDVLQTRAV